MPYQRGYSLAGFTHISRACKIAFSNVSGCMACLAYALFAFQIHPIATPLGVAIFIADSDPF